MIRKALKLQAFSAKMGGFDSHALPPFILIKSIGSLSENRTKAIQPHQKGFFLDGKMAAGVEPAAWFTTA